jgi:KDO2-lipid IV(A) lauroyltransferase
VRAGALAWTIACLPWSWLRPLGAALGFLAGSVLRIRRRHVEASLRAAGFAAETLAPRVYASLGAGIFELLWLAGRPAEAVDAHFTVSPDAAAALARARQDLGRGVVVATAHTGNWDLAACAMARRIAPATLAVVTKRLSWKALDRTWQSLRAERGVVLVEAAGATAAVRAVLGAGGVVAMMVDQAPERASGVASFPFLGRVARHDLAPLLLAARARAPLLVLMSRRTKESHHRLYLMDVIDASELRGRGAVERASARVAAGIERFVREYPDQWLWLHRRWK